MSDVLYPELPGLSFSVKKTPTFITKKQISVNGREMRAKYTSSPKYTFSLSYEFLRDIDNASEIQTLMGFFMQRYGSFDSFLFKDPDDYIAENMQFGVGDGVTTTFQLSRTYGGFVEPVTHFDSAALAIGPMMWNEFDNSVFMWPRTSSPLMWDTSWVSIPYSVSSTGVVTFSTPPSPGEILYWSGEYYFRCRFIDDAQEFEKFMHKLWLNGKCEFVGSLGNKI